MTVQPTRFPISRPILRPLVSIRWIARQSDSYGDMVSAHSRKKETICSITLRTAENFLEARG